MTWIQTNSGKHFDFKNPRIEDICIDDIANALSFQCRFNGHCNTYYSVAEHLVLVSHMVPELYAYDGLCHDFSEAYLGDIPKPLKRLLPDYVAIENTVERILAKKFNIVFPFPKPVKESDNQILVDEANHMMSVKPKGWLDISSAPIGVRFHKWSPKVAKQKLLERFEELSLIRNGPELTKTFMEE